MSERICGTCTRCCEGWLTTYVRGQEIYPGKPCIFVEIGKGCKDYENRPQEPCKRFACGWIKINDMPEKFKPEVCGVIMHIKDNNGNPYISLTKAPNNPTEEYLSWAIDYAKSKEINIVWAIDDKFSWLGNEEFCKQMEIEVEDNYRKQKNNPNPRNNPIPQMRSETPKDR